ncbi:MAG: hypothetical protein ACK40S_01705 [Burkholderiaceae bacterium]
MSHLEQVFDELRNLTPDGRKQVVQKYQKACFRLASFGGAETYVAQKLASLDVVVRELSKTRRPLGFDESSLISHGLGDLSSIRGHLHYAGVLDKGSRDWSGAKTVS